MFSLYAIFYQKLPCSKNDLLFNENNKLITFLNPYYLELLRDESELYCSFDYICSDGILPILLNKLWNRPKSVRISFDMTSLAKELFIRIENTNLGIYFIGSEQNNIKKYVEMIQGEFPCLNVNGYHHGYIANMFEETAKLIIESGTDIVVIGMGAPLQDKFAIFLHEKGFRGTIYTCGGFFHQTTKSLYYYPNWVDMLNLRAFYRIFKEPYVLKRVLKYYPSFIIRYSMFLWKLKLK